MNSTEHALFESLVRGPLLVGDLPEAARFSHLDLIIPESTAPLNLDQKLGHLYEDALAVLLEASPRFDLLAKSLQIRTDVHTTVGELDFLVRDGRSGPLIHLELATKFYLAVEGESGLLLPGPDARDNYFKKLQRLREHQLTLAKNYREDLPERYRDEEIVTRQLIYGCLFDHVHAHAPAAPDFIHPDCRRGRWLSVDECAAYFPAGTRFQIIPKSLWPVPLDLLDGISLEAWTPQAQVDRCVMLRVNDDPNPCFVAPSGYPDHATTRP
jgi:hypothetical protein